MSPRKTPPAPRAPAARGLKLDPASARRIAKAAAAAGHPTPPHVQAALDEPAPGVATSPTTNTPDAQETE